VYEAQATTLTSLPQVSAAAAAAVARAASASANLLFQQLQSAVSRAEQEHSQPQQEPDRMWQFEVYYRVYFHALSHFFKLKSII
jgi:hypothetical protein